MSLSYSMLKQQLEQSHVAYQRIMESNKFLTECNTRQAAEIIELRGRIYTMEQMFDGATPCDENQFPNRSTS